MTHYYTKPRSPGKKNLIPLYIHGHTFEFLSYQSLFSGTQIDPGTMLLLENLVVPERGLVLDIGCGYGVIGIVLAKINPRLKVYMVDINPLAVKTARYNAKRNGVVDNTIVLQGDLYEPVKELRFNAIYSNPPFSAGMDVVERLIREARSHLQPGGFLEIVASRAYEKIIEIGRSEYSRVIVLKKRRGYAVILMYK